MRYLGKASLCCLVLLSLLVLAACAGSASDVDSPLADNEEVKEAQDEVSFTLILPTYIPNEYVFRGVHVQEPPPVDIKEFTPKVEFYFSHEADGALMNITQMEGTIDVSGHTNTIDLGETTGEYSIKEREADDATVLTLAFSSNEIGIGLVAKDLPKSEAIKIAESMLED